MTKAEAVVVADTVAFIDLMIAGHTEFIRSVRGKQRQAALDEALKARDEAYRIRRQLTAILPAGPIAKDDIPF